MDPLEAPAGAQARPLLFSKPGSETLAASQNLKRLY